MWIHLPSSVCSQEPVCSTPPSDALFLALAQCVSVRGKDRLPQYYRRGWQTEAWMKHLSIPTCDPLTADAGVEKWMESWAASPALTCPLPVGRQGSTEMPAGCSSNTSESFAKLCQTMDGSSLSLLKTSRQFSLFPLEQPYLENLPSWGSMRSGELFEQAPWVPRIDGIGLSSWPTPLVNDVEKRGEFNAERTVCLTGVAQAWRTPNTMDHHAQGPRLNHKQRQTTLVDQISTWPTPRSEDSESCGNHPGAVDSLTGATRQWATPNCRDDHNRSTLDSPRTQRKLAQGWTIDLNEQAAWWPTPNTNPEAPNMSKMRESGRIANRITEQCLGKLAQNFENGAAGQIEPDPASKMSSEQWPSPQAKDWKSGEVSEATANKNSRPLNEIASRFSLPDQETQPPGSESSPSGQTLRRPSRRSLLDTAIYAANSRRIEMLLRGQLEDESEKELVAYSLFSSLAVTYTKKRLNPNFVDLLMGLQSGWTDYAPVETELWYSKVRQYLENLFDGRG